MEISEVLEGQHSHSLKKYIILNMPIIKQPEEMCYTVIKIMLKTMQYKELKPSI